MNPLAANPGLAYRLALIVDGVCRVVAGHIGRDRTAGPTIILVCNDIRRRFFRLAKLMEQVQLGNLPRTPLRPRAAASGAGGARAGGQMRVPRAKGFLVKLMRAAPWEVAVFGSQLQHWLTDPAAASFVASYPQARRILRPIWRMLSRDPLPAVLREPARDAARAPEQEATSAEGSVGTPAAQAVLTPESPAGGSPPSSGAAPHAAVPETLVAETVVVHTVVAEAVAPEMLAAETVVAEAVVAETVVAETVVAEAGQQVQQPAVQDTASRHAAWHAPSGEVAPDDWRDPVRARVARTLAASRSWNFRT